LHPSDLISLGISPQSSTLEYFYSGIDALKHDLLAGASADARTRAGEIVMGTERSVGALTAARAGVFQIREPYSTEVAGYGMHSTSTRKKEITVTVHATFALR
jgi:hypothetical protein